MGVFDQSARLAAHGDPDALVHRVLAGTKTALRFKDWADSRTLAMPGDSDRTADHVAVLEDDAAPELPWLLVFEFQSRHDPDKVDLTLEEAARIRIRARHGQNRQGKFRVLTALIYLQGRCPDVALDMTLAGFGTRHVPLIWNVAEDSAEATVATVASGEASWGMLFWVPLMAGGDKPELPARWVQLASAIEDRRRRGDLALIALVFAELAGRSLAWQKSLEGFDMTESMVVNRLIQQGVEKGRIEDAREKLTRLLRRRLPTALTEDVVAAINTQPSLDLLNDWFDAAIAALSPEEFLATLRR